MAFYSFLLDGILLLVALPHHIYYGNLPRYHVVVVAAAVEYCSSPHSLSVFNSRNEATMAGLVQRSNGVRQVGFAGQLKRWLVSCGAPEHSGHSIVTIEVFKGTNKGFSGT
jgi:hypothetical protein